MSSRWGPSVTPKAIQWLIALTCGISIFAALFDSLVLSFFQMTGLQEMLSLSWKTFSHFYFWEPLTYLFIQQSYGTITLSFFIGLAFNMYLLWVLGTLVLEYVGTTPFLRLYFISGILAGLAVLMMMQIFGSYSMFAGCNASIYAIMVVWAMLFPEAEILIFFIFPIKVKWLIAGLFTIIFLIDLSNKDFTGLTLGIVGAATGYFYGLIAWDLRSPFPETHKFDAAVAHVGTYFRQRKIKTSQSTSEKIIDIGNGQTTSQDDEAFVDAMLTKISQYGEKALTPQEKHRLDRISRNKQKKF